MNKEIIYILKQIEKYEFKAYIVGGFVRDYLLGKNNTDIDVATSAQPKDLIKIFPNAKIDSNYGSVKLKTKNFNFDITSFREETYKKDQLIINYITDLQKDALRRDFTINAIYMDKDGNIEDPFNGINDLNNKKLRVIGDVNKRFKEDPLRILRAIRFKTELEFKIDKNTVELIHSNKNLLKNVSHYKKKEELNKIFTKQTKIKGLEIIKKYELDKILELKYDNIVYSEDPLGIWAQIDFSKDYPWTKQEKNIIDKIKSCSEINNEYLYKNGLYISLIAGEIKGINKVVINKMYKNLPIKSKKDIKINYKKIINLGYKENEINDIIKSIEKEILNNNIKNTRFNIIKYLKNRK